MRRPNVLLFAAVTAIVAIVLACAFRYFQYLASNPSSSAQQTGMLEQHFQRRHAMNLQRKKQTPIDLVFLGDSITEGWQSEGVRDLWDKLYAPLNAINLGVSGDRTQQVIWRISEGGELDGLSPRLLVLMIGTNNIGEASPQRIARGVKKIIGIIQEKLPRTKILLLSVLPRDYGPIQSSLDVQSLNQELAKMEKGGSVRYLYIADKFLDERGGARKSLFPDGLHLSRAGYQVWAEAMQPTLDEMMKP